MPLRPGVLFAQREVTVRTTRQGLMHERSSKAQDFRCMIEMVVELTSHENKNILYWVYPSLHRAEKKTKQQILWEM